MGLSTVFYSTLLLSFSWTMFLSGIFGAYFGKGKSRSVGFVLSLFSLLLMGLFAALTWPLIPGLEPQFDPDAIGSSVIAVLAATLGAVAAVLAFITSVMKS